MFCHSVSFTYALWEKCFPYTITDIDKQSNLDLDMTFIQLDFSFS